MKRISINKLGWISSGLYAALWCCERMLFRHELTWPWLTPKVLALIWYLLAAGLLWTFVRTLRAVDPIGLKQRDEAPPSLFSIAAFPLAQAFCLAWLPTFLSSDVYAYVLDGVTVLAPDGNPYLQGTAHVVHTPMGQQVAALGWALYNDPTPYGPLVTWLEATVAWIASTTGQGLTLGTFLLRAVTLLSWVVSAAVVWRIRRRLDSERATLALVTLAWNPLFMIHVGSGGHNDALMAAFSMAALAYAIEGKNLRGYLAQGAAVITKFVPVLLAPAQAMFALSRAPKEGKSRVALGLFAGLLINAAILVALFWRFWAGAETFQGVAGAAEPSTISVTGIWVAVLKHAVTPALAATIAKATMLASLLGAIAWLSWRARDERRLINAWAWIAFFYYFVASGRVWPWYAVLPITLFCAVPGSESLRWVVILSGCALLGSPVSLLKSSGAATQAQAGYFYAVVVIYAPLAFALKNLKTRISS